MHGTARRLAGVMLVVATVLAAGGCDVGDRGAGDDDRSSSRNEPLSDIDLAGAQLTVGSKDFTEQIVLGHIARLALEEAGAVVDTEIGSSGTVAARTALLSGEIDLYWEYTGTAWSEFLGHDEPISDPVRQYAAVAAEDLEHNDIEWLEMAPFNNTYAIAINEKAAAELDVDSVSDLGRLVRRRPQGVTICIEGEFSRRDDGLPGLERHYGFEIPDENVLRRDPGVIYAAIDRGSPCTFGEVFATDARISAFNLFLLEDDEQFFPVYNPAVTIRSEVLNRHPNVEKVFARIAPVIDTETMIELNRQVDIDGRLPEQVARQWLEQQGFVA